jgi:hypothetical protein
MTQPRPHRKLFIGLNFFKRIICRKTWCIDKYYKESMPTLGKRIGRRGSLEIYENFLTAVFQLLKMICRTLLRIRQQTHLSETLSFIASPYFVNRCCWFESPVTLPKIPYSQHYQSRFRTWVCVWRKVRSVRISLWSGNTDPMLPD